MAEPLGIAPSGQLESKGGEVQATKHDGEKPRYALIPARAKEEVAKVFTYGGNKYDVGNWHAGDSFDYDRLQSASERHAQAFAMGEDIDPESGFHHLAHKVCCDMMLLELVLAGHGNDNRNKAQYLPDFKKGKTTNE